MNVLTISGNLVRDYEVKYTSAGKPVGSFSLAVNDGYGENKHVSYFDVSVFGKFAEQHKSYIGKGSKVAISGSIRQDRWESNGEKRSAVKVIANRIEYLSEKQKHAKQTSSRDEFDSVSDEDIPF